MTSGELRESLIDDRLAMTVIERAGRPWHLLPGAEVAAGAGSEESPSLIVIAGASLFTLTVAPGTDDEPAVTTVLREPLIADQALVRLDEQISHRPAAIIRHRTWTFLLTPGRDPIMVETTQKLRGGFPDDREPSTAERLARVLAHRLGYPIADD
jgi:hypothetical protein